MFSNPLVEWYRRLFQTKRPGKIAVRSRRVRLTFDGFEDRIVPAAAVTNVLNSATNAATGSLAGSTNKTITISGSGFQSGTVNVIQFGTTGVSDFTVNSDSSITCAYPAHAAGTVDVRVVLDIGTSPISKGDVFTYHKPRVDSVTPSAGPLAGGTPVTIVGQYFTGASEALFGAAGGTSFVAIDDQHVSAASPAGTGAVNVYVMVDGTQSDANPTTGVFSYSAPPTVTSLSTTTGPNAGNTPLTINGAGFNGVTSVLFGTTPLTLNATGSLAPGQYKVTSSTTISAVSPAGNGTVDVVVATGAGTSITSGADQFFYATLPLYFNVPSDVARQGAYMTMFGQIEADYTNSFNVLIPKSTNVFLIDTGGRYDYVPVASLNLGQGTNVPPFLFTTDQLVNFEVDIPNVPIQAERVVMGVGAVTTIAAASNNQTLPQTTINVVSTAGFAASGSLNILTAAGVLTTITYTGVTATSFTGCSGGTGTLSTGGTVRGTALAPIYSIVSGAPYMFTTIASTSNGLALPQATINVNGTDGFPTSGTLQVLNDAGVLTTVTYTGKTGTSFTGCSGGTGTLVATNPIYAAQLLPLTNAVVPGPVDGFAAADTLYVQTSTGMTQITYTGLNAAAFTGANGGVGQIATGDSMMSFHLPTPRVDGTGVNVAAPTPNLEGDNIYDFFEFSYLPVGGALTLTINTSAIDQFGFPDTLNVTGGDVQPGNKVGVYVKRESIMGTPGSPGSFATFLNNTPGGASYLSLTQDGFGNPLTSRILSPSQELANNPVSGLNAVTPGTTAGSLDNATNYYYTVTALAGAKEAAASDTLIRCTPTNKSVNLSWQASSNPLVTSYNVYRGVPNGASITWYLVTNVTASNYNDTGAAGTAKTPIFDPLSATFDTAIQNFFTTYASGSPLTLTVTDGTVNGLQYTYSGTAMAAPSWLTTATGFTGQVVQFTVQSVGNNKATTISGTPPALPLNNGTLAVASTTGFPIPAAQPVTLQVQTTTGTTTITYTGITGNTFTGVSGGSGTLAANGSVTLAALLPVGATSFLFNPFFNTNTQNPSNPSPPKYGGTTMTFANLAPTGMAYGANGVFADNSQQMTLFNQGPNAAFTVNEGAYSVAIGALEDAVNASILRGVSVTVNSVNWANAPSKLNIASGPGGGDLVNGTTYYYVVTALNAQGESTVSNEVNLAPTNGSTTLTWAPVNGATGYHVYRGTAPGQENLLVGTLAGQTPPPFNDTVLAPNLPSATPPQAGTMTKPTNVAATATAGGALAADTYYYVVTALGVAGESLGSTEVSAAATASLASVTLTWNVIGNASGYKIYRGAAAGQENVLVGTVPGAGLTGVTFVDAGAASQNPPPNKYYALGATSDTYAEFFHQTTISIGGLAYADPFDDQGNQSSTIAAVSPTGVTVNLVPWGLTSEFNDAPVIHPDGNPTLGTVDVSAPPPTGTLVSALIASDPAVDMITDTDAGARDGLAIVGVNDHAASFTPFNDDFNRVTLGGAFTVQTGAGFTLNGAVASPIGASFATVNGYSFANVAVQANVALAGAGSYLGLVARSSGPGESNLYLGTLVNNGGVVSAEIWKNVAGVYTRLTTIVVPSGTALLRLEVLGSSLRLLVNGLVAGQVYDTSLAGAGRVGLRGSNGTYDNLLVESAPAQSFFQTDDFTRTTLGGNYTLRTGLGFFLNGAVAAPIGFAIATDNTVNQADVAVEANVTLNGAGSYMGLVARYAGAGDTNLYLGTLVNNGGVVSAEIWKNVAGAYTRLTTAIVPSGTALLRLEVLGSSLRLLVNGVVQGQIYDTSLSAAGLVGLRGSGGTYDNFKIENAPVGDWQFSTDNGNTWSDLGDVSDASARLLAADANTRVRFLPNPGAPSSAVVPSLTFRAWDRTTGKNGSLADATTNGGVSPFSAATEFATETLTLSDTFNGGFAPGWQSQVPGLSVSGGHVVSSASPGVSTYGGLVAADVAVQADVSIAANGTFAGVVARYSGPGDTNTYAGFLVARSGQSFAEIWKNVAGTWTRLTSAPAAIAGTLRLEVVGSSLTLLLNGQTLGLTQDTSITAAGAVGLRLGNAGPVADNFLAASLAASSGFNDDFTRANAPSLGSRYTDLVDNFALQNGQAAANNFSLSSVRGVLLQNVSAAADISLAGGALAYAGLAIRHTGTADSNMYWAGIVQRDTTYTLELWKAAPNFTAPLATAPLTSGAGRLRIDAQGTSLKIYVDDVLKLSLTDSSLTAAGDVALRAFKGTIDNLTIDAL